MDDARAGKRDFRAARITEGGHEKVLILAQARRQLWVLYMSVVTLLFADIPLTAVAAGTARRCGLCRPHQL
eukprot:11468750-Alexandrium_andersonii.AAC.1